MSTIDQITFKYSSRAGRMLMQVPYNKYLVCHFKRLGLNHAWNAEKKFWGFDAAGLTQVVSLVKETFGELTITYADGSVEHVGHNPAEAEPVDDLSDVIGERIQRMAIFG